MDKFLQIQRASAGSGKTYTLAKQFLWYFLTVKVNEEGEKRRLRTVSELEDSLSHILAVTFTNKATNEMKERIVKKLFALAYPGLSKDKPDYMDDFVRDLHIEGKEEQLTSLCKKAVSVLLNNYSEFQVSTIDSFFQIVLRTFAYESDLNDSYQIELDSSFLTKVGLDAVLEDINSGHARADVRKWIKLLMDRSMENGGKWNIFQKKESNSLYNDILNAVNKLQTEDFKRIRPDLETYFRNNPDLVFLYDDLKRKYETPLKNALTTVNKKATALRNYIDSGDYKDDKTVNGLRKHAENALSCNPDRFPSSGLTVKGDDFFDKGPTYSKLLKKDFAYFQTLADIYKDFSASVNAWKTILDSEEYKNWRLYSANFPYLGLIDVSLKKRREYLEENNAVELGETNAMLRRIIGDDDAPFIYERIGTRLNHFLIDEFQDTSELQWENLRPLLDESLSRSNENLIIGDAKQSIYRFRNADPSLITTTVPETFPSATIKGNTPAENTNWRSDRNVVEFNNRFFKYLASGLSVDEPGRLDFNELYSNVEQYPKKKGVNGYVELNLIKRETGYNSDDLMPSLSALAPEIVGELRSRKYLMKDIAFLVYTNAQGEAIIRAFAAYNATLGHDDPRKIEFISEESLKVASSEAVTLVVNTLETINRGVDPKIRAGEEAKKKGVADWNSLKCNFRLFSLSHKDLPMVEMLDEFLKYGSDYNAIEQMLAEMQSVSLPALVEAIIVTFIPEYLRREDAAYLAAFQDIVLEYCNAYPTDISSFLEWWKRKGASVSITSPEDTDAVRVMTVHKSKGLEFKCVVMPFVNVSFFSSSITHPEWRWVEPRLVSSAAYTMPPYIPVDTTTSLRGTSHERELDRYIDMRHMDELNKLYVGFTRAKNELYVFASASSRKNSNSLPSLMEDFFENNIDGGGEPPEGNTCFAGRLADLESVMETGSLVYGEKYAEAPKDTEKKEVPVNTVTVDSYGSRRVPESLKYREANLPAVVDADNYDEAAVKDTDPRSEGNMFHFIMENVVTAGDVASGASKLVSKGLITEEKAKEMGEFVALHLERLPAEFRSWFDGTYRVLNERHLLGGGAWKKSVSKDGSRSKKENIARADRIMCDREGNAIVVDYKFGQVEKEREYSRQVRGYVERLKSTGRFKSAKGYIWYVALDRIVYVCD